MGTAKNSACIKVLLVEDNPLDVLAMKKAFSEITKVNFELICVSRLQTAIAYCRQVKIDAVLLNFSLPDSQGIETFYRLYAEIPDVPILLFSGIDESDMALKAVSEGAQDYLVKHTYTANGVVRAIQYARERHKMVKALENSNRDLAQFAYFASHDLQSPLRAIIEYLEILQYKYGNRLDVDAHQIMEYAIAASGRLKALINNLLIYSQVDLGKKTFEVIDFSTVISEILNNHKKNIEEKRAVITYHSMPSIRADKMQITQLFDNLIGNALKFSKVHPVIDITAKQQKEKEWLFSVKDNGIGLDMKYADSIFESFNRLNGIHEYPGTGLGLAICKRIVERHGGRIWADSMLGKGSIFYFTITEKTEHK